jgi:chromosome segregation ATPase
VIFLQSSSQLKLLSQTNTELLTVFIENVDSLNEDVAKLTPALDEINNLTNVVETASAGLATIGEKSDMLSEKSDTMSEEVRNAIEKMNMIEPLVKAQLAEQQEKSAILNSELTLSFAEMTNEEFKAQNMIMGNFTRSVIEALQTISDASAGIKEQRDAIQALQEVNAELSARVATLDQKLSSAKKEAAQARKARARAVAAPKPEGDIIKFP